MTAAQYKSFYLIIPVLLLSGLTAKDLGTSEESTPAISASPAGRSLFSPRVDYNNKWTPVGRGDPLKNDPTYDYSPPVLDRVRYWGDANKNKNEILLLGVSSKRPIHRKMESKNMPIRRNYYPQLPTVLMPPPMQTFTMTHSSPATEISQNMLSSHATHNSWPSKISSFADASADESNGVVSIVKPNIVTNSNPINSQGDKYDTYKIYSPVQPTAHKKPWIQALLQKEVTKPATHISMEYAPHVYESHRTVNIETTTHFIPTIPPSTMTTDELFSHYKQPNKPMHGPMYLIIQGHSKVKTYGQNNDQNTSIDQRTAKIVPVDNTENPVITRVVSEEDSGKLEVKHLHSKQDMPKEKNKSNNDKGTVMGSLLSLLDTSFGDYLLGNEEMPNNSSGLNSNEILHRN